MDLDGVAARLVLPAVHGTLELGAGHGPTRVFRQRQQERELPSRQLHRDLIQARHPGRRVDFQVAEAQQNVLDASEPPAGIPPAAWRARLAALQRKLAQAKTAATAAHAKVTDAQQGAAQAQAQVRAADAQIAAATAAVQATQAAIAAMHLRRQELNAKLTEIERMNVEITRDPMAREALQQVAAELSARTATLEDSLLTTRFELEDAETLLAGLLTRRNELTTLLAGLATQIPEAEAQMAAAQRALAEAEAEVTTLLQDGP